MNRIVNVLTVVLVVSLVLVIGAAFTGEGQSPSEISLAELTKEGVTLALTPPAGRAGRLEVELCTLKGDVLAKASRTHEGQPVKVQLGADVNPDQPADYYVRWRFDSKDEFQQRSLYFLTQVLETIVLAQREYLAGTEPVIQILVRDRAAGTPVADAAVRVTLTADNKELVTSEAKTNFRGEAPASLKLPAREIQNARLKIEVRTASAHDTVEETIQVRSGTRTLLTTDKPMYQPGQTIHLRALSLQRPEMTPLKNAEVLFEVEDSKGNKVFKKQVKTDDFGVSHADFVLADELNQGAYRIRHIAAGAKEEKTVTVERYVLPKFKVNFTSDRRFYQPGETVKGEIQVDYFFGKPVAGAQVHIACSKFDVEYTDFQAIEGKTDDKGHYTFEVKLPDSFVGQPLEAGKASARFEITVIDTADHREQVTRNLTVTANPVIIAAVPEGGDLVPGLENRIYVVTTYADSAPAKCKVTWANAPGGRPVVVETDAGGFGEFTVTPEAGAPVNLKLEARDAQGNAGTASVEFQPREKKGDEVVLLRADRALYKVGDLVKLTVSSSRKTGTVYVDVIKDRQTWLTKTLDLKDGAAAGELVLDPGLAGTLDISAYLIGANGVIVRDRRLVVVDPANDLSISVSPDQDTYLPGGEARISFKVLDKEGQGVAAALGVIVVDEAVFALQEMQPGLEKVYFYLEKELAKPRYEIHGFAIEDIMPRPTEEAKDPRRDDAAKVLLASAAGAEEYPIQVNTYDRDNKGSSFEDKMQNVLEDSYNRIRQALDKYGEKRQKELEDAPNREITMDELIVGGFLRRNQALDPWGHPMKISGKPCSSCHRYHDFTLQSAGIDGAWGTADDVSYSQTSLRRRWAGKGGDFMADGVAGGRVLMMAAMPEERAFKQAAVNELEVATAAASEPQAGAAPPRIREYFPETLLFQPALITDAHGLASLTVPLADSITTWRMTCMASSLRGALGSTAAGLRVFQDFFVDVDFPVSLTQNDEISVPVAVYNYLQTEQDVKLVAEKADWFELRGAAEQTVKLGPSEVKAVYFPIVAKGIGFQKFTVFAYGAKKSDAVRREVEIVPDGKEELVTFSGRLEGNIVHGIIIPENAIPGASKIFAKVYPGVLSQVIEGLDKMLRMPFGCFEQTSSVTYPNILVLDYMKTTGKITPELQMKAEGFINAGYQRLVSFEVKGGGFEWFGNPPAHRILTAYGLMEFFDMSKVFEVDPAVINRTQVWLANGQEKDGSWKPSEGGIAEGAIDAYRDDVLRTTAYVTWALAYSGYHGPQIERGVGYLREHLSGLKDNFTLALAANALATINPKDETTLKVLQMLFERRTEEKDMVYWKAQSETPTCGRGESADIEVTGLAVQAFITGARELGTIGKAVTYLAKNKDAYGTWHSTQATIQALRAMLMAERGATQVANAKITVTVNGKAVQTLTVDKTNSDVLQLVDMKELTATGTNTVELKFEGEGSLMYQVVGRYYLPYPKEAAGHEAEPMTIALDYDRTQLAAEDILKVTATVTYNRPGGAKMVIVDLGLPPGFTLIPDELNKLVESKVIEKYSTTGRQIIVYLRELLAKQPVKISYQLMAKYPLKAKTAKATVYEYYNPQSRAEASPVELTVL